MAADGVLGPLSAHAVVAACASSSVQKACAFPAAAAKRRGGTPSSSARSCCRGRGRILAWCLGASAAGCSVSGRWRRPKRGLQLRPARSSKLARSATEAAVTWHPGGGSDTARARAELAGMTDIQEDARHAEEEWDDEEEEEGEGGTYSCLGTHREMIEDAARTSAFREAIFATCKDKVVLEVGCGTGILSVFASQAGATRVVAVEADLEMASFAQEIVDQNNLDNVTVIAGRIEERENEVDLALLGDDPFALARVDVVISEWMGFMLVCEDMFPSVAFARERWLRPGGIMIPQSCSVWVAPICFPSYLESVSGFWRKVQYGVDFSPMADRALEQRLSQPVIATCPPETLLARPIRIWNLDCGRDQAEETQFQNLRFECTIDKGELALQGVALWFTCEVAAGVTLSTSPEDKPTHWEQTLLFRSPEELRDATAVAQGDVLRGALQWDAVGDILDVGVAVEVHSDDAGADPSGFARRLVLQITS